MIIPVYNVMPKVGNGCFIAPDAWLLGNVTLGEQVSVFFGAVLRGDIEAITVGSETNIQEHALLHTSHGRSPAAVGSQCTIGHKAIIHGCTVGDRCLVGMGAIILDDAVIEDECLIGAGALIPEGMHVPKRSLVIGMPGKVVRELTEEEAANLTKSAADYVDVGQMYRLKVKKK